LGKKRKQMAVTGYSVFLRLRFGPNYLRNVAMNIPLTLTSQEGALESWKSQATIDQKHLHNKFYAQTDKKSSHTTVWSFTYKNFDALDKSSTI
jgi:hypothetical protein